MIKAEIYFDGKYYCAKTLDMDVFTQGKTIDEVMKNLREAVSLHLDSNLNNNSFATLFDFKLKASNKELKEFKEDLEFARRTEEAYCRHEMGDYITMNWDDFINELESCNVL